MSIARFTGSRMTPCGLRRPGITIEPDRGQVSRLGKGTCARPAMAFLALPGPLPSSSTALAVGEALFGTHECYDPPDVELTTTTLDHGGNDALENWQAKR